MGYQLFFTKGHYVKDEYQLDECCKTPVLTTERHRVMSVAEDLTEQAVLAHFSL